jgi:hypothetical protein
MLVVPFHTTAASGIRLSGCCDIIKLREPPKALDTKVDLKKTTGQDANLSNVKTPKMRAFNAKMDNPQPSPTLLLQYGCSSETKW